MTKLTVGRSLLGFIVAAHVQKLCLRWFKASIYSAYRVGLGKHPNEKTPSSGTTLSGVESSFMERVSNPFKLDRTLTELQI